MNLRKHRHFKNQNVPPGFPRGNRKNQLQSGLEGIVPPVPTKNVKAYMYIKYIFV
jgi:hypothetical protein